MSEVDGMSEVDRAAPATVPATPASPTTPATTAALRERFGAAFMGTYGTPPVVLVRGDGVRVWDTDGREYLDCIGGIAVSVLGHAHPAVVAAVTGQVATLVHTSNLAVNLPALRLAERLRAVAGGGRVFLCNSGAEANEAALKVVRRYWGGRRGEIVAVEGSFHGRTLGALSITGQPAKREPFAPLIGGVRFVPHGDAAAMRAAVTARTAAVFVEPVLGEAGVIPAPPGYLEMLRQRCDETGALLVLDEIQGGMGRTGEWFSHQSLAPGVRADVLTLAKGLGGGLPIGACLALGDAADALGAGDHGTTFGGNPVCAAAALAVIDQIDADDLMHHARVAGERLTSGLRALEHPLVDHVRGLGLWQALLLRQPVARDVETSAREHGLLVNAVRPDVIRLAPALVIGLTDVDRLVELIAAALDSTAAGTAEGS